MSRPVSLLEMLDAREKRSAFRRSFFADSPDHVLLLQYTVNIPGSIKNNPMIREIFDEGLRSLSLVFSHDDLIFSAVSPDRATGPEGFFRIVGEPEAIKRRTSRMEEDHPLGRLWDIDVFTGPDLSISRGDIGWEERLCLLCDRRSHECARSGAHSVDLLLRRIEEIHRIFSVKESPSGL